LRLMTPSRSRNTVRRVVRAGKGSLASGAVGLGAEWDTPE